MVGKEKLISEIHEMAFSKSYREIAESLSISPSYLSDILLGKRDISHQIAEKLGYIKISQYKKK